MLTPRVLGRLALPLMALACGCGGGEAANDGGGGASSNDGGGSPSGAGGSMSSHGTSGAGAGEMGGGGSGGGGSDGSGGSDDAGPGPTQECSFTKDADGFFTLTSAMSDYVARLPASYDPAHPTPTRLLVAIHGCNDTAYNFATWGAVPYALRDTQDYIAISLGGRDHACWTVPGDKAIVDVAIAHVRSCFYVHQKKIVLAGYSSGGDLTYVTSMNDAAKYAGILIEHSDLSQNVGAGNVDDVLAGAAWKLNVSIRAGHNDMIYPIDTVKSDYDKMVAAGFPAELVETQDTHDGTSTDWEALVSKMGTWQAP